MGFIKHIGPLLLLIYLVSSDYTLKTVSAQNGRFQIGKDLLLAQFDCKTDVDDLHAVAAFATLMAHPDYVKVDYHAVAGTYGTQDGPYVPPNELFKLAFGDNWSDAHSDREKALLRVKERVNKTLDSGGNIWIADAGQSDFSALLIQTVQEEKPTLSTKKRFHVVQHSQWNESVTSPSLFRFVQHYATYHKIPDGNVEGNGSPGFKTSEFDQWRNELKKAHLTAVWELAIQLANQYNGKEGRYTNKSIAAGGLDFSDLSETCWILGIENLKNAEEFFKVYVW